MLVEAKRLKQVGESIGLEPLITPQFELSDTFNGHKLSIISVALNTNNVCYYCGPHQNGAIFVEFSGVSEEVYKPVSASVFSKITLESIQKFVVDHKIFIVSFLFQNSIPYEWSGNAVVAHFQEEGDLKISFEIVENFWRISSIKSV